MKVFLRTFAPAIGSGIALALCFPRPHLFPLAWIALVPLLYRVREETPRRSAAHFFLAGWVFHSLTLQWLATNIYWAGGWALWGQQLMCLALSAYWAVAGLTWRWLVGKLRFLNAAFALALVWVSMELLQATLFTGFGWTAIAYSQTPDLALVQWAALGGTGAVTGIIIYVNGELAAALSNRKRRFLRLAGAAGVVGMAHVVGVALLDEPDYGAEPFQVGLFQSSFPLEMKWDPEYTVEMVQSAVSKSATMLEHAPADLVVWPEALVTTRIDSEPVRGLITGFARDHATPLFTGSVRSDSDPETGRSQSYNSGYLVTADGEIGPYYDKIHLAPFGEYVPLATLLPFVDKLVPMIGGLSAGNTPAVFALERRKFAPLICFEMLFAPMAAHLRAEGAEFLVVITNLSWFGASNAIPQELEITRMRAIETRLPVVQCANTGISGVIDPWGRFTLIDGMVDGQGNFFRLRDDLKPAETIRLRLAGVLPVPNAEPHPLANGPRIFPWAVLALLLLTLAGAGVYGNQPRNRAEQEL